MTKKSINIQYEESGGCISLEYLYLYPPGIPLIVPGERISERTVRQIKEYLRTGFEIRGTKETGRIEVLDNG